MGNAREFVSKTMTDDEFLKEVCRHGGFDPKAPDADKQKNIQKAGAELGYSFTVEEYGEAFREYFGGGNPFKIVKAMMRIGKIQKAEAKEKR